MAGLTGDHEVLHRDVRDGIPVFWVDAPGAFTGGLLLGMGVADEEYRESGIGHAIEHLAMSAIPPSHLDRNASIGLTETEFSATGPVDAVVEFLDQICTALGDLPLARLEREAGVLDAEGGLFTGPAHGSALALRYGYAGVGLAAVGAVPARTLGADQLVAHAARHAVRGNAAAFLSGPPPAGLRLPLVGGEGHPGGRREPPAAGPAAPGWTACDTPWPALSFVGPDDPALRRAGRVLVERLMRQLRHEQGLVYEIHPDVVAFGDDIRVATLTAECREDNAGRVAELMWAASSELAASGPTQAELDHDLAGVRAYLDDPRSVLAEAAIAAAEQVNGRGLRTRREMVSQVEQVGADQLAAALDAALGTAYLLVPWGQRVANGLARVEACAQLAAPPPGSSLLRRRLRSRAPRGSALFLAPDGIGFRDEDGDCHMIRWRDCVGVGIDGDLHLVTGRYRCHVPVDPAAWRGGQRVLAALQRNLPPELFYPIRG